jgi:hypothetical protein
MYQVEVPVKNERAKPLPRVEPLQIPVVLPSDLLRWMWSVHPAQFEQRILGSKSAPLNFWQNIRDSDEVWVHPGLADKSQLHMCVPWTVHGDGVPFRKQGAGSTSLQVISQSSLTGHGPTIDTHFLFCGIPNDIVVKPDRGRGNLTSDPLWEVLVWDLESCMNGTSPHHDQHGEPWLPESDRALLAGEPICGGYKLIHIQNRGDLDWHCNETCMQHWSSNEPCFRCKCSKRDVFDWDAPWAHGGHVRAHPEHPLFKARWVAPRPRHVAIDPAHTLDKGITELTLGSLLKTLVYEHQLCGGDHLDNLRVLNVLLQSYYDERKSKNRVRSILLKDFTKHTFSHENTHTHTQSRMQPQTITNARIASLLAYVLACRTHCYIHFHLHTIVHNIQGSRT